MINGKLWLNSFNQSFKIHKKSWLSSYSILYLLPPGRWNCLVVCIQIYAVSRGLHASWDKALPMELLSTCVLISFGKCSEFRNSYGLWNEKFWKFENLSSNILMERSSSENEVFLENSGTVWHFKSFNSFLDECITDCWNNLLTNFVVYFLHDYCQFILLRPKNLKNFLKWFQLIYFKS